MLLLVACGRSPGQPAGVKPTPASVSVTTSPVTRMTLTQTIAATGNVAAVSEVNVIPQQPGRIEKLVVDVGSTVKAGDVIARLEHTTQDLTLETARSQLSAAQAKLATIKAGPRAETVAQAELNVSTALAKLQAMKNGPRSETVGETKANLDAAQAKLQAIKGGPRPETVAQAKANLAAAQAKLQALKAGPTKEQIAVAQQAVEAAKDAAYAANVNKDGACNPRNPKYQCDAAQAQTDAAATTVNQAQAQLKVLTSPPTAQQLQEAQAAVDAAEKAYELAQKPYTTQDVAQAQAAVDAAQQAYELAQKPYTAQDLQEAQNAVAIATQQLQLVKQPYTAQDRQQAQAGVDQAQAMVDQAVQAVKDTTITAPISGVVSQEFLNEGALASTTLALVSISSDAVNVQAPIAETQIPDLKVGDIATISGAALGSKVIPAKVTTIAPSADTKTRTVTVEITPDRPGGLRPGMFVQVIITALEHPNVTAVPTSAIIAKANGNDIFVVQDGVVHEVPVALGLSSTNLTEITKGVSPGQIVVVQGQQGLTDGERVTTVRATPVSGATRAVTDER